METVICLQHKEDVHSQPMGDNYSILIPGFSGPGNDLRLVLTPEATAEVIRDMRAIETARELPNTVLNHGRQTSPPSPISPD